MPMTPELRDWRLKRLREVHAALSRELNEMPERIEEDLVEGMRDGEDEPMSAAQAEIARRDARWFVAGLRLQIDTVAARIYSIEQGHDPA